MISKNYFYLYYFKYFKYINLSYQKEYNKIIVLAIENGHIEVVKLMLGYKIDNPTLSKFLKLDYILPYDLNWIMAYSSYYGHINIVKFIVKEFNILNNKYPYIDFINNFNWALIMASKNGQLHIVRLMLDNGANSIWWALNYANENNHMNIVKYILDNNINKFEKTIINNKIIIKYKNNL